MENSPILHLRPMDLLLQGLLIGATLTVMVGPITFTILDSSFTGGVFYGIITAFGMWCSDLLYVCLCFFGARQLQESMNTDGIADWVGVIGGIILIAIGIFIWKTRDHQATPKSPHRLLRYSGHWLRGFVVNTFAPFSLFFWPTVTLTIVLPSALSDGHALSFYAGVMISIMTGDVLKSAFAGWIRERISPKTIRQIRVGLAVLFVGIGLFSVGKVVWDVM